jgi:hypothetical protein
VRAGYGAIAACFFCSIDLNHFHLGCLAKGHACRSDGEQGQTYHQQQENGAAPMHLHFILQKMRVWRSF